MRAEEIQTGDDFFKWWQLCSPEWRAQLQYRSTLRSLPSHDLAFSEQWAQDRQISGLPVLRGLFVAGIALSRPDPRLKEPLSRVHTTVGGVQADLSGPHYYPDVHDINHKTGGPEGVLPIYANVEQILSNVLDDIWDRTFPVYDPRQALSTSLKQDVILLERQISLVDSRLFHEHDYQLSLGDLLTFRGNRARSDHIDFWLRWWDGVLTGNPLNWDLQREVALIPEEVWQAGPGAVAEAIREIEGRFAISVTQNGEEIEPNPATGRLRLVPTTVLPENIAEYARRKIEKAIGLFDTPNGNQMYSGLASDLRMLSEAMQDAGNLPVELFDTCASAARRLSMRVADGQCPSAEKDPIIADYQTRIRDVAADILANDPVTQEVLQRRNAITGNNALIEAGVALRAVSTALMTVTEGRLSTSLPTDAEMASNPNADPEDRKAASVRISGRLLRIMKLGTAAVVGTIVRTKEVLQAIPEIQASPIYQQALAAILRWLGL